MPNQAQFVWNPYIEFMRVQQETNEHLVIAVNRLEQLCGKLVDMVGRQQTVHRNRHLQLRERIWEVHEKLRSASIRQEDIRNEIGKQGDAVFRLRNNLQNHRMSMRAIAVQQYDDLQDIMNLLDRISDDHAKFSELQQAVIGKLDAQDMQRRQEAEDVQQSIERILFAKKSVGKLLSALPLNYPIQQIVVEGAALPVKNLLNVDERKEIAYFTADSGILTVAIDKIDAIHW